MSLNVGEVLRVNWLENVIVWFKDKNNDVIDICEMENQERSILWTTLIGHRFTGREKDSMVVQLYRIKRKKLVIEKMFSVLGIWKGVFFSYKHFKTSFSKSSEMIF